MVGTSRSESDRARWDRKYSAGEGPTHFRPNELLRQHSKLLTGGRALDVGCGFGGNALFVASRGYQVDGVDASGVALARAQCEALNRGLQVNLVQADLEQWWIRAGFYDLVTAFCFLNRDLVPELAMGLRPGGLLFQANRNTSFLNVRSDFNEAFLVEPGELPRLAVDAGLEVIYSDDSDGSDDHASRLIARRPD